MIDVIYRSKRAFKTKGSTAKARVEYNVGEMKSVAGVAIAVIANNVIIDVVCTFDDAIQLINKHWEQVKAEAVNKSIDKELKKKHLVL